MTRRAASPPHVRPPRGARLTPPAGAPRLRTLAPIAALVVALGVPMTLPGKSAADVFGPIALVSESSAQQAEYAHDPAISADGRYVAFDGSIGGVEGVWRRDLQTGEVQLVVSGSEGKCEETKAEMKRAAEEKVSTVRVCQAELPSISANGRYVSFTTDTQLVPDDTNKGPDVYVRDMNMSTSEPGAFTLASAVDGSAQGLAYELGRQGEAQGELETAEEHYGSVASGRSALSADGRQVAFVTTSVSNLDGPGTPGLQVALRDLDSDTTQLVSVAYDPATGRPAIDPQTGDDEPVSASAGAATYGAVYAPDGAAPPFAAPPAYNLTSLIGASISADGSTVAWMGQDVGGQAPTLTGDSLPAYYAEPLWRRVADGPQAPTRRITGGSDPAAPACLASGEVVLVEPLTPADPCEGPFRSEPGASGASGIWTGGLGDPVPQLSANGLTVAFLSQAPTFAQGADFGQNVENLPSDLFVVDMAAGLTRVQALTQLTELAGANLTDLSTTAPIVDLGISPDGGQVAFTTRRTSFPLGSPAYVSARAAVPGMVELFDADLANDTLTRVTQSFEGGPAEHPHGAVIPGKDPYGDTDGALSPSFSGDGDILAFSSTASNLVYGDGNTPPGGVRFDGADAFVVGRIDFAGDPAQQYVSPPPPGPPLQAAWLLGVTAVPQRDGNVVLDVDAPAAGSVRAGARAVVVLPSARPARAAGTHHPHRRVLRARVASRTVAAAKAGVAGGGPVQLLLALAPPYRVLSRQRGGLSGTVTVTFTAPGRPSLRQSIPITFLAKTPPRRPGRAARAGHRGRRRGARTGGGR
jgi:hypothetical protein